MPDPKKKANEPDDGSMSLAEHLRELRNRIIVCVLFFAAGLLVCLAFAPKIVTNLADLGLRYHYNFVYLAPQELLMCYMTIALIGGIVAAAPAIAYEGYAFASPGLSGREKTFFRIALVFGSVFFVLGVLFAYGITVPFMLHFLISFSADVAVTDSISIAEYLNFILPVFLIFGIIFELPVVSVVLTRLGILRPEWLIKARKVMIVAVFFIAAVITPPDVVSQIMVAVPMLILYELSIRLSALTRRFMKDT
jgi:sec-independent protein translocase protein TatC